MTEKELRNLKRFQLLELLIMQTKETEKLQGQLEEIKTREQERDIQISNLGSVAEASLELNGVFTAAQKAADQYIEAAKKQAQEIVENAERQAAEILRKAQNEMDCVTILKERFTQ